MGGGATKTYGGLQNGRGGGHVKFTRRKGGGGGESFSHAEGSRGDNKFWGSFYAGA